MGEGKFHQVLENVSRGKLIGSLFKGEMVGLCSFLVENRDFCGAGAGRDLGSARAVLCGFFGGGRSGQCRAREGRLQEVMKSETV